MYGIMLWIIIGLFIALLFVNIYFRLRVIKHFRNITKAGVEFGAKHIFNDHKLETEVIPRYPNSAEDIRAFAKELKFALKFATGLFLLICLLGWVLMKWR